MDGKQRDRPSRNTPSHPLPGETKFYDEAYRLGFRSRAGVRSPNLGRDDAM
jgi:hypothetical protein